MVAVHGNGARVFQMRIVIVSPRKHGAAALHQVAYHDGALVYGAATYFSLHTNCAVLQGYICAATVDRSNGVIKRFVGGTTQVDNPVSLVGKCAARVLHDDARRLCCVGGCVGAYVNGTVVAAGCAVFHKQAVIAVCVVFRAKSPDGLVDCAVVVIPGASAACQVGSDLKHSGCPGQALVVHPVVGNASAAFGLHAGNQAVAGNRAVVGDAAIIDCPQQYRLICTVLRTLQAARGCNHAGGIGSIYQHANARATCGKHGVVCRDGCRAGVNGIAVCAGAVRLVKCRVICGLCGSATAQMARLQLFNQPGVVCLQRSQVGNIMCSASGSGGYIKRASILA